MLLILFITKFAQAQKNRPFRGGDFLQRGKRVFRAVCRYGQSAFFEGFAVSLLYCKGILVGAALFSRADMVLFS